MEISREQESELSWTEIVGLLVCCALGLGAMGYAFNLTMGDEHSAPYLIIAGVGVVPIAMGVMAWLISEAIRKVWRAVALRFRQVGLA